MFLLSGNGSDDDDGGGDGDSNDGNAPHKMDSVSQAHYYCFIVSVVTVVFVYSNIELLYMQAASFQTAKCVFNVFSTVQRNGSEVFYRHSFRIC